MAIYDSEGKQLTALYGSDGAELEIAYDIDGNLIYSKRKLTGITAAYSGGTVVAGTTLDQLTGIRVTATYSDGSTATVAAGEYMLSGTLTAGQDNTVTVTYQGKTATFVVTVESAESEEPALTGFRFYVPGLDNAPAETSISNTVANQGADAWHQAYDDIAPQTNASGTYTDTRSPDD